MQRALFSRFAESLTRKVTTSEDVVPTKSRLGLDGLGTMGTYKVAAYIGRGVYSRCE